MRSLRIILITLFSAGILASCGGSASTVQLADTEGDSTAQPRPLTSECIAKLPGEIKRSPALMPDGHVLVLLEPAPSTGPRLVKLAQDGTERWTALLSDATWSLASPPVVRQAGEILVTLTHNTKPGQLLRINPENGSVIQRIELNAGPSFAPAPLPPGPILITSGNQLLAFDKQGVKLWDRTYNASVTSDVVVGTTVVNLILSQDPGGDWSFGFVPLTKIQRLAAFGLESGELAWMVLGNSAPFTPLESKNIPLFKPTIQLKRPFFVRQPGAFDRYNFTFVVAEDISEMVISPEGLMTSADYAPKNWENIHDIYEMQYGPPTISPDGLPIYFSGRDGSLHTISHLDHVFDWSILGITYGPNAFGEPSSLPPSPITTADGRTYGIYRTVFLDLNHPDSNRMFATIDHNVWTSVALANSGYFFGGGDSGCLVRITLPSGLASLDKVWPRYRNDNRNSGVRWESPL